MDEMVPPRQKDEGMLTFFLIWLFPVWQARNGRIHQATTNDASVFWKAGNKRSLFTR
jgi:hypothetical protein